jgi:SAM-dependent methyltransferase
MRPAAMTYARYMPDADPFDELLEEADEHPVDGWDFSWLGDRLIDHPLPWDYEAMLLDHAGRSPDLLDLGTGGGEFLAGLPHHPGRTVATEAWPPNVEIARRRLRPLGIEVVEMKAAGENAQQNRAAALVRLPFPDESFALMASRHESYVPSEVARVLRPGGVFLTQQVGGDYREFYKALDLTAPPGSGWNLGLAISQLEGVGLQIRESAEGSAATTFSDIGAFAWYLKAIPWVIDGFSIETHRFHLTRLHRRFLAEGPITIRQPAFWVEAIKPYALSA